MQPENVEHFARTLTSIGACTYYHKERAAVGVLFSQELPHTKMALQVMSMANKLTP